MRLLIIFVLLGIEALANVGKVYAVRGEGFIYRGADKIAITLGAQIDEHDRIVTSKATKIQVIFEDRTIVTVGQNTEFSVNTYVYDKSPNSTLEFGMKKGIFKSVTGKLGKLSPQNFKIKTENSTIGIRGTTFVVSVTKDVTLLGTLAGKTYFIDHATAKEFSVGVHQQLVYNSETKEIKVVPLKIQDVKIANPKLTTKEERQVAKAADKGLDKGLDKVVAGGIPLDTITDEVVAVVNVEQVEQVQTLVSNLVDDYTNETPTEERRYLTHGGSYGYNMNVDGTIADFFAEGPFIDVSQYMYNGAVAQYVGSLDARVDGVHALGAFTLKADFSSARIDGTVDFTDYKNRNWGLMFSQNNGITSNGFYVSSDDYGSNGISTGDIMIDGGRVDGYFFGNTANNIPVIGEDSVGGTFSLYGYDASGNVVNSDGAFGAWMVPDLLNYAVSTPLTYGGSFGYYVDDNGYAYSPFVMGTPLDVFSTYLVSGSAIGQYSGVVYAIIGGVVSPGSFALNADFMSASMYGNLYFLDNSNRQWDIGISQSNAFSGNGFYISSSGVYTGAASDITVNTGFVEGSFFGNSANSQPIVGDDSLGGFFAISGTDTLGNTVDAEGSLGGPLTSESFQVTMGSDTYSSFGYWESGGIATTPWVDGIPLDAATMADYTGQIAYGYYAGNVAAITSTGGVTAGTFSLYADFGFNAISGTITVTDANNLHWDAYFNDNTLSPISGNTYTVVSGQGFFTNNTTPIDVSVTDGNIQGTFYGAPYDGRLMPQVGKDSTGGTFTLQGDNGGQTETITGSFSGPTTGGV